MRLALVLLLASARASAQPADSVAVARRPAWLTLGVQISYRLEPGDDANWDYLGASVHYHRSVGPGPFVAEAGASSAAAFLFGTGGLSEGHVAVGASTSVGPLFVTATAGPSLGRAYSFASQRGVFVPGAYASVQTQLVFVPIFGIGAEAFAHLNVVHSVAGFGVVYAFGRLPGALIPHPPPTPRRPGP